MYKLSYEDKPDYEMLKGLFLRALKTIGQADDCTGLDWIAVAQGKKVALMCMCPHHTSIGTSNQRKSPDVITSPFSKAKRRHVEEEVDAGDEVSQIKPTMAKGVRKQAVTKKRSSPKGRKVGGVEVEGRRSGRRGGVEVEEGEKGMRGRGEEGKRGGGEEGRSGSGEGRRRVCTYLCCFNLAPIWGDWGGGNITSQ